MEQEELIELLKTLPVDEAYKNVLKKPGKEISKAVTDIIKAVRLLILPVQVAAAYQDKFANFIDTTIRRVPSKKFTLPASQIIGPVLEGIKYEPEDTPIYEMFADLLSSSMDSEKVNTVHPSYPLIIKQLSSDEAIILKNLKDNQYEFIKTYKFKGGRSYPDAVERDDYPKGNLTFPSNIGFYMQHLNQLGLAGIFEYRNQEPIFDTSDNTQTGSRTYCKYRLTDLGHYFVNACIYKGAK